MTDFWLSNARLMLPDRELLGSIRIRDGIIQEIRPFSEGVPVTRVIDFQQKIVCPGFVDLHVHGGGGSDFMDGDLDAFQTVCETHFRHGTTTLVATSTAGPHEFTLRMLRGAKVAMERGTRGAQVAGVHLYGPHFHQEAKGCHPSPGPISDHQQNELLDFASIIRAATIAPEHPSARSFAMACKDKGIRLHMGHSHCTFQQAVEAVSWGVRHVDHLFCAMSDRARLRLSQTWPMRGGLLEATLGLDELTTEVIPDGCHLAPELLFLAWKIKGSDRLALVTDSMRGLDMPAGEYLFGPRECLEWVLSNGRVGLTRDGAALASSIQGMDECVRVMTRSAGIPLWEAVKMASLTPARIAGLDSLVGSLEQGKKADLVVFNEDMKWISSFRGVSWVEISGLINEK